MLEGEPDTVALTASVGPLRVTVQGPLREATVLLQHLQLCDLGQADSTGSPSPGASAAASGPCLYTSFRSCQAALGPISQSPAVLHGFPSEPEAKVYVDAAGLVWPLGGQ